jgi:sugar/nucleoside kinase (ribokinase family)
LNEKLVNLITAKAKFLAVNTQANTGNYGFNLITKYPRADYVCLDEPEARLATQSKFGDLKELIVHLGNKLNCKKIMITRGHLATLSYDCQNRELIEVPVFSGKVVDTVGAGDAFFSITSLCASLNWPTEMIAFIGNVVGALAVGIVGNRSSVESKHLFQFITTLLK